MIADTAEPDRLILQTERPQDGPAVEALDDRAFGPGRFTKVSERVREFAEFRPELSFCAFEGERLVGTVRQWRVDVGGREVIFLGPLAVEPSEQHRGIGGVLVARACEAAEAAGFSAVLLVGDPPYFNRFGFEGAGASGVLMPGPVDQRRVMARLFGEAGPLSGPVAAAR